MIILRMSSNNKRFGEVEERSVGDFNRLLLWGGRPGKHVGEPMAGALAKPCRLRLAAVHLDKRDTIANAMPWQVSTRMTTYRRTVIGFWHQEARGSLMRRIAPRLQ